MQENKCRRLLRIPEARKYLDNAVSAATLRAWVLKRKIEVVRLHGTVTIPASALDELIERGRVPALGKRR